VGGKRALLLGRQGRRGDVETYRHLSILRSSGDDERARRKGRGERKREKGEGKNCELCFGFIAICLLLLVHAMETCSRGIRRSGGREDERDKGRLGVELVSEGLDTLLLLLGLGSVVDGLSKSGRGSVRRSKGSRRRGRVRGKEK
jgi:hypothetical protein